MDMNPRTNPERITALEVEIHHFRSVLENEIREVRDETKALQDTLKSQNEKLDSLLELRAKGMGALWFASAIIGSGVLGLVYLLTSWMRGEI